MYMVQLDVRNDLGVHPFGTCWCIDEWHLESRDEAVSCFEEVKESLASRIEKSEYQGYTVYLWDEEDEEAADPIMEATAYLKSVFEPALSLSGEDYVVID